MAKKEPERIIEIEPFEIGNKEKSKIKTQQSNINSQKSFFEYNNNDVLRFNLYVDYTKIIYYKPGIGNYNPIYREGKIINFKKVDEGKGSYKEVEGKKKFYLTLLAKCPKCNNNELKVRSLDNIHSTLLDLEEEFGGQYLHRDEGSEKIASFTITAKIEDEEDDFFDLDLKCLKCSRKFWWDLTVKNEHEVSDKIWEIIR